MYANKLSLKTKDKIYTWRPVFDTVSVRTTIVTCASGVCLSVIYLTSLRHKSAKIVFGQSATNGTSVQVWEAQYYCSTVVRVQYSNTSSTTVLSLLVDGTHWSCMMWAQRWQDMQLRWDPARHGGIRLIRVHPRSLWRPDIVFFNK